MGWQDALAKHHPIPAFFAAVISNVFTGNKADDNQNTTNSNSHSEPSSPQHGHYGPTEIQPVQYYYPPRTPISSSSQPNYYNSNEGHRPDHYNYNENHRPDHYNSNEHLRPDHYNSNEHLRPDHYNSKNDQQITKPKGFWRRRKEHVVEKGKGYGEKGKLVRTYRDGNGDEVMEERDYHVQSYYELQLSPARVVDARKNNGSYQGAGRSRYY